MSYSANVVTVAVVSALCVMSTVGSAAFAQDCPLSRSVEITEPLVLYGDAPEPWWFFPLVLSRVEQIGMVRSGQRLRICESAQRSSWQQRSLWLRVVGESGEGDGEDGDGERDSGGWVNVGPVDLESFLARQGEQP